MLKNMKKLASRRLKKQVAIAGATVLVGLAPVTAFARESNVNVGDEYASYGYSLDANQRENTKRVLGAENVLPENELTMTQETYASIFGVEASNVGNIYSSSHVRYEEEGHGVEVNIATPEYITKISSDTYANAAITAGFSDVELTVGVGNNTQVTGEGALASVYLIHEKATGVPIESEVAQLTNEELALNSELGSEVATDNPDATSDEADALTNGLLADIKNEVAKLAQKNNGEIADGDARDIVINIVNNYGLNLSDETIQKLIDFAKQFSQTEIALSPEMQEQLAQLGNTLKEKGGDIWDGVQSKLQDPEFQESAGNLWTSFVNFIKNLFSGIFGGSEATD